MDSLKCEILDDVAHLESGALKSSFTMIAPYFENLSTLKVLDLSHTNIQSLPPSISMLSLLENLTLKECSMLRELPPEIGILKNLETFDLEGTEIMYLPKEMGELVKLRCLRVSLCANADEYKDRNGIEDIIPRSIMPKFRMLEELSICVNPDAKWWEDEVIEAILKKLHFLPFLQTLKLYLPTEKVLQYFLRLEYYQVPIYSTLQDFCLKIGHSEPLTSYLKTKLVDTFEKLEKCLKFEKGEGSTDDMKELVRHAAALFVYRHWTIEKLSIFDLSRLKYCLLAECNEMHTLIDADEFYTDDRMVAFQYLEYLAIHSMKKLEIIWKGPIARNSFSCLKVLALHTCPGLISVFTEDMHKLHNLIVVIVEDCPKVKSLVSQPSTHGYFSSFLPNLRKIVLLDLPELVSLSNGVRIAPVLDTLLVFNCLKLDYLSHNELPRDVKEIKGETEWWDALKNRDEYSRAFVPLKRDGDLMNQLAEDTNSLKEFHKLQRHGGARLSLYEKKHPEWEMFMQFLKDRKPSVPLVKCNSGHIIEFLKYLNKFGDIRVHVQSCVLFGHPNPAALCFCPLREALGTLEAIAKRLHVAYNENKLPVMKPISRRDIQSYLNEVRKSQENASGIPSPKKGAGCIAGDINNEGQAFSSPGAVAESIKLNEHPQVNIKESTISGGRGSKSRGKRKKTNEAILEAFQVGRIKSAGTGIGVPLGLFQHQQDYSSIMDDFRTILQDKFESRKHSLSVDPGSTNFLGTSTQDSSSTYEVKEENYVISNTMSPQVSSQLRNIAVIASSKGYIQPLVEIYIAERQTMMQRRLIPSNIEKWNNVTRFEWGVLESLIKIWINSVKTSFHYLLASEKQLCENIFHRLRTDIEDICYEVIIQCYQVQVFNIIYTLSFSNPLPDKLFLILDLYNTLDHFLNERRSSAKSREPFQAAVHTQLLNVLADKIISSLSIFEMVLLYHESSVIVVGPIGPLPRYVMSYLHQLCEHTHALRKLSLPKLPSIDEDDLSLYSEELKGQGELSRHVIWIIMKIVSNLEVQAKLCQDGSAGHFFAMKNIGYIVHEIEGHQGLREVVGYDYFGKLIQKLDHAKLNYLRLELEKIIEMRDYGAE